ncbi:MAG: GGDEF domain-containing protein [Immundisolibacter sp.]|uniref:GGDEF domain-containing protein n=1 Tax=Immundisolibacter sp. TaxID=1934948 RepID=UPI003D0B4246
MNEEPRAASETLLRDIITQLCAVAGTCNPELAGALTALDTAARDGQSQAALRQAATALSELTARGAQRARPGATALPPARPGAAGSDATVLIQGVLRNLSIPTTLEPLARDIQQAIDRTGGAPRRDLVDQTLHLMAEAKAHGEQRHRELQDFLKTTVGRLVQLENAVTHVQSASRSGSDELAHAREVTQAQFIQLRSVTTETDDLEELKSFIGERLEHLQDHLKDQDEAGDEKQRRLEETLVALSGQVAQLSAETVTLRSRLDVTTEEALRDPLTGAYNRLAYERRAALEVARWRSDNGKLSMIVCDIDHFKRINDSFGHAAGDKVLKEVVRLLQEQLRSSDFVARYGGEEFVILLSGAAEDAALQIAEKLRRTIKAAPFRSRGERVPVTISCGVGTFGGEDTLEAVFERTDAALYAAKAQGRDRCVPSVSQAA